MRALTLLVGVVALPALAACGQGNRTAATPTAFVAEGTPVQGGCSFTGLNQGGDLLWASIDLGRPAGAVVRFAEGEPVPISLNVRNCGTGPVWVTFFSSQRYEMIVENSDGHEVWRWSNDLGFAQLIVRELLTSVTYSEEWDQRDNRGQPVPPGRYEVTAWLTGLPHEGVDVGPCRSEQSNCFPSAGQSIVISP